jgi:N-methylhydantoinase A
LPTVSDANAVLGYLHALVGGDLTLDVEGARAALNREIGEPLGLDPIAAASGLRRLVNAHMADAMRVITGESAISPADLMLVAYGGAGPVHASALARELGIQRTIIPVHPGALSALGVAVGDLIHDFTDPILLPLDIVDPQDLSRRFDAMTDRARLVLADEGVHESAMEFQPYMIARYIGQMHDLQVELPIGELHDLDPKMLAIYFHNNHKAAYGVAVEDEPVFVVDARLRAIGRVKKPEFRGAAGTEAPAPIRQTEAWFEDVGAVTVPVFSRSRWLPEVTLEGPAIIQEYDSTTVVLPGQKWHADEVGSIVIEEQ